MTDEEIIKSVDISEEPEEKPVEVQETPKEETPKVEPPKEQEQAQEPPAPAPKPNLNEISDLDKARFSFQRQLGKQKSKYEQKIGEWEKKYGDLEKRLAAIENPEKPILRSQFQTDDQMVDAIVQRKVEKLIAERDEKMQAEFAERQRQFEEQQEHAREIEDGINHWFPDDKRKEYVQAVETAFNKGLSDLLEQEKNVLEYLHQTPNSSIILYKFATDPAVVKEIFEQRNPLFRLMAVRDLENKLIAERSATPAPAVEPPAPAAPTPAPAAAPAPAPNNLSKTIGKPGAVVEAQPDIFENDDALTKFVRGA